MATRRARIRSFFKRKKAPGPAKELKRYNKRTAFFEFIGIPSMVIMLLLVGWSKLWSVLGTTLYVMIGVFGILAVVCLIGSIIYRFKRWNNHQSGFGGLVLPVLYIFAVYYAGHFAYIYLAALVQLRMYM